MQLRVREYGGTPGPARPTLVLLHGLFGSAVNWHGIARRLQGRFHLLVPDLRNHGRSPHHHTMDYPAMAADVVELLDGRGLERVFLVGHSMGGKAAMWLALEHSERVRGLVPVDIAPVRYRHGFDTILQAMESLDVAALKSRDDADRHLARTLEPPGLRGYLLQNLVRGRDGWGWRLNLPALRTNMDELLGFPAAGTRRFPGDSLFIYGGRSDYVAPEAAAVARELFPFARMRAVPEAGHWVYSDAPQAFLAALEPFLEMQGPGARHAG